MMSDITEQDVIDFEDGRFCNLMFGVQLMGKKVQYISFCNLHAVNKLQVLVGCFRVPDVAAVGFCQCNANADSLEKEPGPVPQVRQICIHVEW